ncbi:MAG: Gfo/Idh/MocA family oxidoreductase [Thermodesulfobacteriota bacterium]
MAGRKTRTKIRAGVVGTGYLGRFHAEKYAELEGVELVGVADLDLEKAREVAAKVSTEPFPSHKDLLDRVDAVSVVTPTETHHEIGMDFLSKGVDVLIEKPIAVTAEEAGALIEEAEKRGAVLQVGHLERFNSAVVALEGKLTAPMFIEAHRLSTFTTRALDVDVVLDLMIHDIDIILNLVDADVEAVEAVGIPVISDKVDIANARLKFTNGCVANVTASRVSNERLRRTRLFQPDAYIAIDYAAQHISISRRMKGEEGGPPAIVREELDIERKDSLMEEIKSFIECSAGKKAPLVSGRDGRRALEVAHRIQESVDSSMAVFRGYMKKASDVAGQ